MLELESSLISPDLTLEPAAAVATTPRNEDVPEPIETVIRRRPGWQMLNGRELWKYRELLYFLVWRDIKVRYKQTILGVLWAVIQPLSTMIVFSLFFGRLAEMPSGGVPYPLFAFAGLLPWTFFANSVSSAGGSVVGSQNLVTKVYFPRLFIPLGAVGAAVVDFLIACGMMVLLMAWYGVAPSASILLMPVVCLLLFMAAVGVGTLLSALTVAYRDFRHVVPFMVQLWLFATPCIYMPPTSLGSPRWHMFLPLNPMYGLIATFRSVALGSAIDWYSFTVSATVSIFLVLAGLLYFRRVERSFADII